MKKGRKLRSWEDTIRKEEKERSGRKKITTFPFLSNKKIVTSQRYTSESITTNGHRGRVKVKCYPTTTSSLPSDLLVFNCINKIDPTKMINRHRRLEDHHHHSTYESSDRRRKFVNQSNNFCRRKVCRKMLLIRKIQKNCFDELILVMFNRSPAGLNLLSFLFVLLSLICSLPTSSAAFGDRIVPLTSTATTTSTSTLSPFYNYKKSYHLRTPSTSTTTKLASEEPVTFPSFDDASPDPEGEQTQDVDRSESMGSLSEPYDRNLNESTPIDDVLHDTYEDDDEDDDDIDWSLDEYPYNYLYDMDPTDLDSPYFFADNDTNSFLNTSSSEIVNYNYNDSLDVEFEDEDGDGNSYNMYPLEPPKLNQAYVNTTGNESISSSGTYSRFRYAPAPYINPFDPTHQLKKVVFINPVDPKPGHHHTPLNVHKIYSGIGSHIPRASGHQYIPGPPIYRDSGPRIKYVPAGMKHSHRLPAHYHIKKYPSGKLGPIHSHEYHHHPNKDANYYGYIPGIPGTPWKDYPIYSHVPRTKFHCRLVKYPGFYADIDTGCQVTNSNYFNLFDNHFLKHFPPTFISDFF